MKDIVLCATQRCGSTMIIEDMRNTGVMGMPEEWFIPWDPFKTHKDWPAELTSVRKSSVGENGIRSVKIMAKQVHKVDACLATFMDTDSLGLYPFLAAVFPESIWIKLTRRDVVAQAVSREMATQTGINHATAAEDAEHFAGNLLKGYRSNYNQSARYNYNAILREVASITVENQMWARFFISNNITPIELFYEDFAADTTMSHLDIIAENAGLKESVQRVNRKLLKMANAKNKTWYNRFFQDAAVNNYRPRLD